MAPKAAEILIKVSKVDKREFHVTRERLLELLEKYKGEELPAPLNPDVEAKLTRAVEYVSGFLMECERALQEQIDDLTKELIKIKGAEGEN